jgi:hypothetical protein
MGGDCQQRGACFHHLVGLHQVLYSKSLPFEDTLGRCRYGRRYGKLARKRRPFCYHSSQNMQVFAMTQSGLVIAAVSHGLGKADKILDHNVLGSTERVSRTRIVTVGVADRSVQMLYASDLLYITATFSSRTAVLCLIHTLSPEYWHTLFTKYCIALSTLISTTAVFMIAFGCDAKAPWSQIANECGSIVRLFSACATIVYISLTT